MFFIRRVCSCFQLAHTHVKMDARMELAPFVAAVAQEQHDLYVAFLASLGIDDNVAAIDIELLAAELQ
jgi:hypothetical protein